ncbi:FixH family protein [Clostridium estertheticum]|uniref:FixH family protein n=1 Tax=Clostridium estertheticum TaxID=238834 RepID=UPI001C0C6B39|nr:FixH family protein [Clostridium estertheticum]MBU3215352.1 FixH family protein [Clostridium estertheticum]WAG56979.1 FixH family protein [Clostridium estertheticum]
MKLKTLKNFVFTLILVLSVSPLAFASTTGTQINKVVDGVKASLTFTNEKLKPGKNEFTISLLDKNEKPLTNSNLKITVAMDNSTDMKGMSGMTAENTPMIIDLKEGSKKGEYTGMVDFKSKGQWIIKSTFDANGQAKNIDLGVNVQSAGPNFLILGVFAGVVVLILVIAAINKKKSIKS